MELPAALRRAVDAALEGHRMGDLAKAASTLSIRYRAEVRDGTWHLAGEMAALAYLATRLPATYAAVYSALAHVARAQPAFAPASLLDVGAGPGTALWAVTDLWPSCQTALMIEGSDAIRDWGERLSTLLSGREASPVRIVWEKRDLLAGGEEAPTSTNGNSGGQGQHDLVTMAYVLDEIAESRRATLIGRLWARTRGVLVIVEPGTPAGYKRVAQARTDLIAMGGRVLAPCPHERPCPMTAPDWCHFSQRVARSRVHRLVKGGEVPWEDEKYAYVAVSRLPDRAEVAPDRGRVLAPPRVGRGHISLKLCLADGRVEQRTVSRRDGDTYRLARRIEWGDSLP